MSSKPQSQRYVLIVAAAALAVGVLIGWIAPWASPFDQTAADTGAASISELLVPAESASPVMGDPADPPAGLPGTVTNLPAPEVMLEVTGGIGYITWTPDRLVGALVPKASSQTEITANGDVTVNVRDDITYVDLQFPSKLSKLVGILVGSDYVALPQFLLEGHVSTIILGDQFPNRQHVYAVWGN